MVNECEWGQRPIKSVLPLSEKTKMVVYLDNL
jgi:hypothetical protein